MKCPKCNYVSHDYLDACRKCGIDLVTFKQDIGLLVLQPGVLDLSLVLGGAGTDDLFESMEEEVTMRTSDDDFDISLDDYAEHPGVRRAPAGAPRLRRPEAETDLAGMDHLTLELDASALSAEMTARLQSVPVPSNEPPAVPTQPPAGPEAITLPGQVTLEMQPENISSEIPTAILKNVGPFEPPPPHGAPKPLETPDAPSLHPDVNQANVARFTPADTSEAKGIDEAGAESVDAAISVVDSSGTLASLPLQDVVLAEDTPSASTESAPEVVASTLPTIELRDTVTTLAHTETVRPSPQEETEEAMGLVLNNIELSMDDFGLSTASDAPSGSTMADVSEFAVTSLDEPRGEDVKLPPSGALDLFTLSEADATLSDLAAPPLNEPPHALADEAMLRPPSVNAWTPTAAETPPEGLLTSSDMFALENLEDPMPPEHLTLELESPVLQTDPTSSLHEDATLMPLPTAPEVPETLTSADTEPGLLADETLTFEALDDIDLPGHLTLALDSSEMAPEVSSITLDNLPADIQTQMPPRNAEADDEEELLLDLDSSALDDEEPA